MYIEKVDKLNTEELQQLLNDSQKEGYRFVKKLIDQYNQGTNLFQAEGECLFLAKTEGTVIGVCGLNQDPYSAKRHIGRIRHLYVSPPYRKLGVGRALLKDVISEADFFSILTLRTDNPVASKLYCSNGFINDEYAYPSSTHYYTLRIKGGLTYALD